MWTIAWEHGQAYIVQHKAQLQYLLWYPTQVSYFGSPSALTILNWLGFELAYGYVSIVFTLWYYGQSAEAITMHVYTCT